KLFELLAVEAMRRPVIGLLLTLLVIFSCAAADAPRLQPVFDAAAEEDVAAATRGEELEQAASRRWIRKARRHWAPIAPARTFAAPSAHLAFLPSTSVFAASRARGAVAYFSPIEGKGPHGFGSHVSLDRI